MVPVAGNGTAPAGAVPPGSVIIAAVDDSPVARLVTETAAELAAATDRIVHVVHAQEAAVAGDAGVDGDSLTAARALVRSHLDQLAAHRVPAEGQILLHVSDHGAAGRMVAEYADTAGASTIVIGAPTHGGLAALMDASASRELWRHTQQQHPDHQPGRASCRPRAGAADPVAVRGAPG